MGFGKVTYRPRGRFGPLWQLHYQLVVIHQGGMQVTIDGMEHPVDAGRGILLEPGREVFFRFGMEEETTHTWCQLPSDTVPAPLAFSPAALNRAASCSPWLLKFMAQGWKIPADAKTPEGRKAMLGAVLCAMGQFCGGFTTPPSREKPCPESLVRARREMEKRLSDSLSPDDLARQAAVSKGHLIKLAKDHWGMTPMEYLWKLRLEEAARLLRETGWNIGEIAYHTGFANPFHFSRRFRQHFGKDPRGWRNDAWGH